MLDDSCFSFLLQNCCDPRPFLADSTLAVFLNLRVRRRVPEKEKEEKKKTLWKSNLKNKLGLEKESVIYVEATTLNVSLELL